MAEIPQEALDWVVGGDTGMSSLTIWGVMVGADGFDFIPYDGSDFGRCYRLLQSVPGWRGRIDEVAARFPRWRPIVAQWDALSSCEERRDQKAIGDLLAAIRLDAKPKEDA